MTKKEKLKKLLKKLREPKEPKPQIKKIILTKEKKVKWDEIQDKPRFLTKEDVAETADFVSEKVFLNGIEKHKKEITEKVNQHIENPHFKQSDISNLKFRQLDHKDSDHTSFDNLKRYYENGFDNLKEKVSTFKTKFTNHKLEDHPNVKATTDQLNELVSGGFTDLHKHKQVNGYFQRVGGGGLNQSQILDLIAAHAETDPIFTASAAFGIAAGDITNWNTAYGWGDHTGLYLPLLGKAADSDLLDGHDTAYFQVAGSYVKADGTVALTADWNVGAFDLTAVDITATNFKIGANTLNTTEWAFLDGQDQAVKTTSSPQFANLKLTAGGGIYPSADSATALYINKADNATHLITFDTTNGRIGIGGAPITTDSYIMLQLPNALGGLLIGDSVAGTAGSNAGYRFTQAGGNLYFDMKTYAAGTIDFRTGQGTESGASRTWLSVLPSTGTVGFGTAATANNIITANKTFTSPTANKLANSTQLTYAETAATNNFWGYGTSSNVIISTGTNQHLTGKMIGGQYQVQMKSTAVSAMTLDEAVALQAVLLTDAASTGIVTDGYGLTISISKGGGSTGIYTNAYGAYINALAGTTKNVGLYILKQASAVTNQEILLQTTGGLFLRDSALYINSDADGYMDLHADTGVRILNNLTIGAGTAGVDYTLTFNGETNDGLLTWMEDEDYLNFGDTIYAPKYKNISWVVNYQDVLASDVDYVHASDTLPNTPTIKTVTTDITHPDVPRNLMVVTTGTNYTIFEINGIDADGNTISEDVSTSGAHTYYTNNAFAKVTSFVISPGGTGGTYTVGISDKLGLPNYPLTAIGDVYKVKKNNTDITVPTVSATYGTVDCATITGGDDYTMWYMNS